MLLLGCSVFVTVGSLARECFIAGRVQGALAKSSGLRGASPRVALRMGRFDPPSDLYPPPFGAERSDTGLAWQVLRKGDGGTPSMSSTVTVHYTGWRSKDGQLFDSSYVRNKASEFKLTEVITGWTEGVSMMQVGEKRRMWIPGALGYGAEDGSAGMPPKGDLVFEIELLKAEDAGDNIVFGFAGVAAVLIAASFLFTAVNVEPEKAEYDTRSLFSFTPYGAGRV